MIFYKGLRSCGKALLVLIGTILFCTQALALDPSKSVYQYNCVTWTRQNGLPANNIRAITQTPDGYLWLGTKRGLVRFDGKDFQLIPVPSKRLWRPQAVRSFSVRARGGLWFGIDHGAFGYFDGKDFLMPFTNGIAPDMSANAVHESEDGSVWSATGVGVGRWTAGESESPFVGGAGPGFAVHEDPWHRIWFQAGTNNLQYWKAGKIVEIPDTAVAPDQMTLAITTDRSGNLWVGTSYGLRCYDSNFHLKEIPPLYNEIHALLAEPNGAIWVATSDAGLARYLNGKFTWLTKSTGLADDWVNTLYQDREGSIWVGTRKGLSQISEVKFPTFTVADGIASDEVHGVSPANDGGIWIASSKGIGHLTGSACTNYPADVGFSTMYTKRTLQTRNNDVYVITGAKTIDVLADGKVIHSHANGSWPVAIVEDSQGVIASFGGELFRLSRTEMKPFAFTGAPPPFYWIQNLSVCADDSVLVSSVNGVFRIKGDKVGHWSVEQGLPDANVTSASEDKDGTIWVGQSIGLTRIKGNKVTPIHADIVDSVINAIVPDDHGNLWISSSRGIVTVTIKSLNDVAEGRELAPIGTLYDGLEAVKTIDNTEAEAVGCRTPDGRIWFPSPQGVIQIDPNNIPLNQVPPSVYIRKVVVNGKEQSADAAVRDPLGKGELIFDYTAVGFVAPQKIRFRYRLEGYDQEWIQAGTRRSALYANLKPKKYTFDVQACNADGVWNPQPASIQIELLPYFYQTAWFRALVSMGVLLGIVGLFYWRGRRMRRKQRKLQEQNEQLESKILERTQQLAEQRNLLRTLIDNLPDEIFVKDAEGRIVVDNVAHARTFGVQTPADAVGKTDSDCLPHEKAEQVRSSELGILKSGKEYTGEEQVTFKNGETRWFRTTKVPFRDNSGTIIGIAGIHRDITERKKAEAELVTLHKQLVETSRQAGMAEVATSVLHNVGNVLNSVNVSASMIEQQVRNSALDRLSKVIGLLREHQAGLSDFLSKEEKGAKVVSYVEALFQLLTEEKEKVRQEIASLTNNVEHIKKIVSMQQSYASVSGIVESVAPVDLLEDSLRMHEAALERHGVRIVREYSQVPNISVDRHKVIQILVNLLHNAKYACEVNTFGQRTVHLRIQPGQDSRVRIEVADNGVGIAPENLTRIFSYGFTTRKNGHGFGLHSGAIAAKEMGGSLVVHSEGVGKGASFVLELPLRPGRSRGDGTSGTNATDAGTSTRRRKGWNAQRGAGL